MRSDSSFSGIVKEESFPRKEGKTAAGERLKAAGRHIKRGLLLYGSPGTGKTLTAMYLANQMQGRTTLLLTGRGIGLLEGSCKMARLLQPATIILEDVDLIAEERTEQESGCNALLFELLNQMDGLADDADILFLLTTNRRWRRAPDASTRPSRYHYQTATAADGCLISTHRA